MRPRTAQKRRSALLKFLEVANIKATILVPNSPKPSEGSDCESAGAVEPGAFYFRRKV